MRSCVLMFLALVLSSCALESPPQFGLSIPAAFSQETERREYRRGAPLTENTELKSMFPDYRAKQPMSRMDGRWTDPAFVAYPSRGTYYGSAKHRDWSIEVQRGASPKVLRAFAARDGEEADLGSALDASPRIYPRFQHKHFSWGEAVSFLVQYQNDNTNYVPNNGMLQYEVHAVTADHRYSVRAQFGLTHPKLTEFGAAVRDYRDDSSKPDSPMRRDPDYILVEQCPDEAFQPSIKQIDGMLETLKLPN